MPARSRKQPATEPAAPGTAGHLQATADLGDHTVDVHGAYYYIGRLANGMLAFATAEPIYLGASEVTSFDLQR